jgi:hypothetical protein
MWRLRETQGLLNIEIATIVGRTVNTVASETKRLRILGFAVPKAPYKRADERGSGAYADSTCAALARELAKAGVYPPDSGLPWRAPKVAA